MRVPLEYMGHFVMGRFVMGRFVCESEYIHLYLKVLKKANKDVWLTDFLRKGLCGVKHYIRVQNFFLHNMGFMGNKRRGTTRTY
jgi:hypothetical protein